MQAAFVGPEEDNFYVLIDGGPLLGFEKIPPCNPYLS